MYESIRMEDGLIYQVWLRNLLKAVRMWHIMS